jgi:polyketide biosynthesis enoyl-CoA hydratase PksI
MSAPNPRGTTMRMKVASEPSGVSLLKMDDAKGRNIFSHEFISEFLQALDLIESGQKTKVLILHGLEDVFCGGADKQALLNLCEGKSAVRDLVICERLLEVPFPVIAAMEGHAIGGGLAVAFCCDMVIAARESRYGAVFMSLGFTPGMGMTTLLADLVGPFLANEMMYTGKRFRGSELEGRGTNINYILPRAEVMRTARDIAEQVAEKDARSLALLKQALGARKKKLLVDARLQEDMMHRITFAFPETRRTILELYPD